MLAYNESIVDLNVSSFEGLHRNRIGPKGVKSLGDILRYNTILSILNIGGNCIGNAGISHICRGLKSNLSLVSLGLHASDINQHGCDLLKQTIPGTNI